MLDKANGFCAALSKEDMMKGYIVLVRTMIDGSCRYSNLREAFYDNRQYLQVFAGLTHNRRELLVIDYDDEFSDEALDFVYKTCESYSLPKPSYFEIHKNGHWQAGWWLDDYFVDMDLTKHKEYNLLVRSMASIFKSDKQFRGGWIKNPYNENVTLTELSQDKVDSSKFFKLISEDDYKEHVKELKSKGIYQSISKGSYNTSRNCYGYKSLIRKIFTYRRETNMFPSIDDCYGWLASFEMCVVRGQLYGIESPMSLWATSKSALNWCVDNYDVNFKPQGKNYRIGTIYKKTRKALMYFRLKELGKVKVADAARILGVSKSYISKLRKEDESDMRQALVSFVNVPNNALNHVEMYREAESHIFW